MRIRFQADADLNQAIVAAVLRRLPEADFRTATDAKLGGLHDLEVLAIAARDGRLLVTSDRQTMPGFFEDEVARRPLAAGRPATATLQPSATSWAGQHPAAGRSQPQRLEMAFRAEKRPLGAHRGISYAVLGASGQT
jgi:hypothetical protein